MTCPRSTSQESGSEWGVGGSGGWHVECAHRGRGKGVSKGLPWRRQDGHYALPGQEKKQRDECAQVQGKWVAVWPEGNQQIFILRSRSSQQTHRQGSMIRGMGRRMDYQQESLQVTDFESNYCRIKVIPVIKQFYSYELRNSSLHSRR